LSTAGDECAFYSAPQGGLGHEEAFRDTFASVLRPFLLSMSDPAAGPPGRSRSLRTRQPLSYFLWSSMPDDELIALPRRRLHTRGAARTNAADAAGKVHGLATELATGSTSAVSRSTRVDRRVSVFVNPASDVRRTGPVPRRSRETAVLDLL
jgi:hypothetical protein